MSAHLLPFRFTGLQPALFTPPRRLLAALAACLIPWATQAASLTGLGSLPGGRLSSEARAVSDDGSVVVGYGITASFTAEAFRWTSGSGMVGLDDLMMDDGLESWALGISGDGSVVVGAIFSSSYNEAFLWRNAFGVLGLGDFPGGNIPPGISDYSEARGVSSDGSVVVGQGLSADGQEPFLWTIGGGMERLGNPAGGTVYGGATGVSGDGSVVVGNFYSQNGIEAFRRSSSGGGIVGLGDLLGASFESMAHGVSRDGSVIVGYGISTNGQEAFRWTSGGGMVGLGDLSGGGFHSEALGVSSDGSVIVGFGTVPSGEEAFVWTAGNGMRSLLSSLLAAGADLTGWSSLNRATGVSADGRYVVGVGRHNGNREGFLADLGSAIPTLDLLRTEGQWRLVWTSGVLEGSPTPLGPWSPIVGAASPWSINLSGEREFFRVRGQ